jgi:hypothetical protein
VPLFKIITIDNKEDEQKYVQTFKDIQINKGFYFSYTYDLTNSLQHNVLRNIKYYSGGQEGSSGVDSFGDSQIRLGSEYLRSNASLGSITQPQP